jgi:RNA polymerase sigma-70 factor (sigma-E family)
VEPNRLPPRRVCVSGASADDADDEYSAFVVERWAKLVRAARLMGCSAAEAEDLVQSTLVKCYLSWSKVRRANDRDAYVYGVLLNTHRSEELPAASAVDGGYASSDTSALVQAALARLSDQARQVVVLRYFADMSERQTAEALNIAAGTVKSRLSRALDQLADDPNLADLVGWTRP